MPRPPSDSSPPSRREAIVTPTGWRLAGRAAERLSQLSEGDWDPVFSDDDVVFAAHFTLRPRSPKEDLRELVLAELNAWLVDGSGGNPPLSMDNHLREGSGRYDRLLWRTFRKDPIWAGELSWTHPHPILRGTSCTTRVALRAGCDSLGLWVHLLAAGGVRAVGGYVGVGQARPAFLERLLERCELSFLGLRAEIRELTATQVAGFVRDVLLHPARIYPVAILAPLEKPDPPSAPYPIRPEDLAAELLGIAHLWVIDEHATTFLLTDSVGDKRLSCFWGALRVYLPGFSRFDSGYDHPLLVADRVIDEVERARVIGEAAWALRKNVPLVFPVQELEAEAPQRSPEPRGSRTPIGEGLPKEPIPAPSPPDAARAEPARSTPPETLQAVEVLEPILQGLAGRLEDLARTQEQLLDALTQLRTATAVRIAHARALDRRLDRLEELLEGLGKGTGTEEKEPVSASPSPEDTPEEDLRISLASLVRNAATVFQEDLFILDSAIRSAEESPFEDLLQVSVVLKAMAEVARRRQSGRLGVPMREAFAELGIDYRGGISETTPSKLRRQYCALLPDGSEVECYEHIVLGNSYDPRYCLRIYFSSRVPKEPRFVIAHVGRHLDVLSTT